MMKDFFKKRLGNQQRHMMKYMRYVLNDHFVIVCMFLFGALAVYYSGVLKTLPADFIWSKPIAFVCWFVVLFFGNLATLLEPADEIFLLPKETQMKGYFQQSFGYSMLLPTLVTLVICGITMPLLLVTGDTIVDFFCYAVLLLALKASQFTIQVTEKFQDSQKLAGQQRIIWLISTLIILGIGLYLFPIVGAVLAVIFFLANYRWSFQLFDKHRLDWTKAIEVEKRRMHQIYRFINLFTDVPEITSSAKRRKFFDVFLKRIPSTHENTFVYLYARSFIRGQQYSGMFFRLVLVAGVVLYFVPQFYLALGISALFLYLIGFQLIPIYNQYEYMTMTKLYPLPEKAKVIAVEKLISILLLFAVVIFGVLVLIALPNKLQSLGVIAVLLAELALFVKVYLPQRLKKINQ